MPLRISAALCLKPWFDELTMSGRQARLDNHIHLFISNQMVNYRAETLNSTFAALADPTRRAILERLASGDSSVTALAEPFDVSLPAISKQLRVLDRAGLLRQEKDGRVIANWSPSL